MALQTATRISVPVNVAGPLSRSLRVAGLLTTDAGGNNRVILDKESVSPVKGKGVKPGKMQGTAEMDGVLYVFTWIRNRNSGRVNPSVINRAVFARAKKVSHG